MLDYVRPAENPVTEDLWARYEKTREIGLRNEIVEAYLYIVTCNLRKMQPLAACQADLEDMASQSVIELIACIDRYDPRKGIQFDTFASIRVRGAMIDYIRKQDWVPRETRKKAGRINETAQRFESERGFPPSDKELAEVLGMGEDEIDKIRQEEVKFRLLALEELLLETDTNRIESVKDGSVAGPDQALMQNELETVLASQIDRLNEQEKTVLSLYYKEELKLKEIAFVMGVTVSRVSQIHSKALGRLKTGLSCYMEN